MSGYHFRRMARVCAAAGFEWSEPKFSRPEASEDSASELRRAREYREAVAEIGGWVPPMLTLSRHLRTCTERRTLFAVGRLGAIVQMVHTGHSYREIGRAVGLSHVAVRKAWTKFSEREVDFERKIARGWALLTADEHTRLPPRWDRRKRGEIVFGRVRIPRVPRPGWPLVTEHPGAYSDRRVCESPVVGWKEAAEAFGWLSAMPYPHWLHLTREQRFLATYYLREKYERRTGRPRADFVWQPPDFGPE